MRPILCLILLTITISTTAQSISYDPPPSAEGRITRSDYKLIVDTSLSIISKRYKISSVKNGAILLAESFGTEGGQSSQGNQSSSQGQDSAQSQSSSQSQGSSQSRSNGAGTLNLDNLVLKCLDEKDKANWPVIIHQHFDNLFASIDEQKRIDVSNFESVKKYLSIRIYPEKTVADRGGIAGVIGRQDLEGTYSLIMLDLPGAFTPVTKPMFDSWKKDSAEAFRAAQANINQQKVQKITKTFPIGDKGNVEINFLGDENYAASYALDLEHNAPEFLGQWGCALSIPNKGLVDLCKIGPDHPVEFIKFIQFAKEPIERAYAEHPQPVSRDFFWYYKGKFTRIAVTTDDQGKLQVIAPMGLAELMSRK